MAKLTDAEYTLLLELRTALRRFLAWSEHQAQTSGLTGTQHQLLLAVRGHPQPKAPNIGELAAHLLLRHHSVVGLVDRTETAGLVRRVTDPDDHRVVRVVLTAEGSDALGHLTASHLEELARLAPFVRRLSWMELEEPT